jgi:hypothetical protein
LSVGELRPSEGLVLVLKALRAIGELLPGERAELVPEGRDLALEYVTNVEKAIGAVLPNDVLVLAALRLPILRRACGLHVALLESPLRDCAGEFGPPRGFVAVASYGEKAMATDVEPRLAGLDTLLCIARNIDDRSAEPLVRAKDESSTSSATPLSSFLRERLGRRYTLKGVWLDALARAKADTRPLDDNLRVHVIDDRKKDQPVVRVRHAKFGLGTIVREVEGGKVEIAFDSAGTKILQRSFVQDA